MIIKLPHIDSIDTLELPDNFEENVKYSFSQFTRGTSEKYTFEDKLSYLDNLRKFLHPMSADKAVRKLITDSVEFQLDEFEELPSQEDYNCLDFMERCYDEGFKPYCDEYEPHSSSRNDETKKAILRIIKIVVNWERDSVNDEATE